MIPVTRRVCIFAAVGLLVAIFAAGCASRQISGGDSSLQPADPGPQATETTQIEESAMPTEEPATPTEEPAMPTEEPAAARPTSEPQPTETTSSLSQANADVLFVIARQESENSWHFTVTVEHPDTGWEDYADGWDVVMPDGTVAKPDPDSPFTRLLLHPHETEQPFTRSQGGVVIEADNTEVTVRAHDLVDGFGGREVVVDLSQDNGPDYEVQRR